MSILVPAEHLVDFDWPKTYRCERKSLTSCSATLDLQYRASGLYYPYFDDADSSKFPNAVCDSCYYFVFGSCRRLLALCFMVEPRLSSEHVSKSLKPYAYCLHRVWMSLVVLFHTFIRVRHAHMIFHTSPPWDPLGFAKEESLSSVSLFVFPTTFFLIGGGN